MWDRNSTVLILYIYSSFWSWDIEKSIRCFLEIILADILLISRNTTKLVKNPQCFLSWHRIRCVEFELFLLGEHTRNEDWAILGTNIPSSSYIWIFGKEKCFVNRKVDQTVARRPKYFWTIKGTFESQFLKVNSLYDCQLYSVENSLIHQNNLSVNNLPLSLINCPLDHDEEVARIN